MMTKDTDTKNTRTHAENTHTENTRRTRVEPPHLHDGYLGSFTHGLVEVSGSFSASKNKELYLAVL